MNYELENIMKNVKLLLICLLSLFFVNTQSQNIDSLYAVFNTSRGEKQIVAANEIVVYCYENGCIDSLIILKTTDTDILVKATVCEALGNYYYLKNDYSKSIDFNKIAIENYMKLGNDTIINALNGSIGANYIRIGNYENAVEYLMKCYEWEKRAGDNAALSSTLNNLGITYGQWQKSDIAIRFFEEAEQVERPLNRPLQYSNRLASLAKEYTYTDAAKSLPLIKEALLYAEKIESQNQKEDRIAVYTIQMGDVYYALDSLENAEKCYKFSLDFYEKNGRTFNVASALLGLGRLQLKAKKNAEAIVTLKKCDEIAEKNNLLRIQRDACLGLSEAYRRLDPNAPSYLYLKKYSNLNDTLFRESSQRQINDFQVKYETAEKQLEIERQQTEIERQRTQQFIYIGGLTLAVLLLFMLVYNIILHRRRNRALAETNALKDKFFSIISHDLNNPVLTLRNGLQMLSEQITQSNTDNLYNLCQNLLKSANGLTDLLQNLLKWAKIQTGSIKYNPIPFNLLVALQSELNIVKSMADSKKITFETLMPPSAIITGDVNMIKTVVRNLLTNAIKFTGEGGMVKLEIKDKGINEKKQYVVSVIDDGVGMSREQIDNLFRIERQQTREGTAGEQSSGLGLIVCCDMLQKHGSKLNVESETGKGSKFWFELNAN
jgi:signal transduction histidine kinase